MLNNPAYIQFLVNPEKKSIAIKVCSKHAHQAHKINYMTSADCEFYSKELLYQLCTVCSELIAGNTYRLPGKLHPEKGIATFQMRNRVLVCDPAREISDKGNRNG